ncbi:MAG: type II toxin-antitoxin system RelE/ParE family toxin [Hespellia sp.]|nr:type II toxin-antitoxin system RelE/ParE family toxin [Hespellia sp.]MDD3796149.1 type II toxin-antitoxin system RelE/ParE family toxin [Lachnospiraceae bacterium]
MSWRIVYSLQARQDLRSIFEYIFNELCAPDTAANQSRRIMKSIRDLEEMPLRYRLYEDEPWNSMGLRFFPVDNYLVFYLPNETKNAVNIVRIMYGGRDIRKQLNETIEF